MPVDTILPQALPRTHLEARERYVVKERSRCAQAFARVADDLEAEWKATDSVQAHRAAVLARGMKDELLGQQRWDLVAGPPDVISEVVTRFAAAIREIPPVAPEACGNCRGAGFRHVINDMGEVCGVCGGAGVLVVG